MQKKKILLGASVMIAVFSIRVRPKYCMCVCSHHYEPEVVSVGVAVVCALDLYFVASHCADLHLMHKPGDTQQQW